jgi:hypothetical protein
MSNTSRIQVVFNHQRIALIFISVNPNNEAEKVATIVPIDRKGKWTHDNLTITLEKPVTEFYEASKLDSIIQAEITSAAAIEPEKVSFSPIPWQ